MRWKVSGLNLELWTTAEPLRNAIPSDAKCVVGNDVSGHIFLYHLRRKGWTFKDDGLSSERLETLIRDGATHLVSNSTMVEHSPELRPLLTEVAYSSGKVRAYRLTREE